MRDRNVSGGGKMMIKLGLNIFFGGLRTDWGGAAGGKKTAVPKEPGEKGAAVFIGLLNLYFNYYFFDFDRDGSVHAQLQIFPAQNIFFSQQLQPVCTICLGPQHKGGVLYSRQN